MKIIIDSELKKKCPDFQIGVLTFEAMPAVVPELDQKIQELEEQIQNQYELADVLKIPNILSAREGYKALGKDPSRYRLAVESLYRRIVKGNSLYRINNLVDLGNVLSLETMRSIAVLDADKIEGDTITIRIGRDEPYEGIGRGSLNIENIPVYCDHIGPFGSPTSDTERTMITDETKNVLLFIISFNGYNKILEDLELAKDLYARYSQAKNFSQELI
jgi:DNA/RNA-binding domain of Phe-tRNA-synthetase-like protein